MTTLLWPASTYDTHPPYDPWTDPENAFGTSADAVLATDSGSEGGGDFGFADITSADIPDGSTIVSVLGRAIGTNLNGGTANPIIDGVFDPTPAALPLDFGAPSLATLRDLSEHIAMFVYGDTGTSTLDAVYLEIEFTAPVVDDTPVASHRRRRRRRGVVTKLGKFRRPKGLKRSRGYPI